MNIDVVSITSIEMMLLTLKSSIRKVQFNDMYIKPDHAMTISMGTLPIIGPGQRDGSYEYLPKTQPLFAPMISKKRLVIKLIMKNRKVFKVPKNKRL